MKTSLFATFLLGLATAAQAYDDTDARALGLLGQVKEVHVSIFEISSDSDDEQLIEDDKVQMTFDEQGRVTLDYMDNIYQYDAQGRFVMGITDKTIMRRDANGHVAHYENKNDEEDDGMFFLDFFYDDAGRLHKVEGLFWEATETDSLVYEGDNVYPAKEISKSISEGDIYDTTVEYVYKSFDEQGNWTERESICITTISSEGISDVTTERQHMLEQRNIIYYSDK